LAAKCKREEAISNQPFVHVLVVDDFDEWRSFVCEKLQENQSFQVIGVASDGLEAVLKAEELKPDLILLDIGLRRLAVRRLYSRSPREGKKRITVPEPTFS
jgi:DNA-binding NarL/FixJ family response regulator